jgi:molecular chaperone GrpE
VSRHSLQTDDTHLLQQYRCFSSSSSEDKNAEEDKNEESDGTDEKEEETLEGGDAKEENKEETLQAEVKTLKDQLLRSLAEQENIRQIARKDVESSRNFAIKSFAKSLLEVSDNLQRALESVDEGELSSNQALSNFYEGINMTNDGLVKAFQSNGVEIYCEQPGEVFDPEMMNALMEYPDPSMEPGTVGQVIKVGFTLNKRVLRPAEVGVVKKA